MVASAVTVAVLGVTAFSAFRLARARDAGGGGGGPDAAHPAVHAPALRGRNGRGAARRPTLRVVDLLDRGVREAQSLETEPAVEAELLQTLGGIAQNLGRLDQADELLERALKLRRAAFGEDHPEVGRSLVASGLLASARGRFDVAEQQVSAGLAMLRRHRPKDDPEVARALSALGRVHENAGKYPAAVGELEEAVRLQSRRPDALADLSQSLTELANCQFYLGQYAQADALNQRVLGDRPPPLRGPAPARRGRPHQPRRGAVRAGTLRRRRALEPRGAGHHARLVRAGPSGDRLGRDHPRPLAPEARAARRGARAPRRRARHAGAGLRPGASARGLDPERAGDHRPRPGPARRRGGRLRADGGHLRPGPPREALPGRRGALEPGRHRAAAWKLAARPGALPPRARRLPGGAGARTIRSRASPGCGTDTCWSPPGRRPTPRPRVAPDTRSSRGGRTRRRCG